jgi:hypothetical protein
VISVEDLVNVLVSPLTNRARLVHHSVLARNDISHVNPITHLQSGPFGVKVVDQFGITTQLSELIVLPRYVSRGHREAGAIIWDCEKQEFVYSKTSFLFDLLDQVFPRDQAAQTMADKRNRFVLGIPYFDLATQALRQISDSGWYSAER